MAENKGYAKCLIFIGVIVLILTVGCTSTAPKITEPTIPAPQPSEEQTGKPADIQEQSQSPIVEEKTPSAQTEIMQTDIDEAGKIAGSDDTESLEEVNNLGDFLNNI